MPTCFVCGVAIARGESRARIASCGQNHFAHLACAATVDRCAGCFDKCRYCKVRVFDRERRLSSGETDSESSSDSDSDSDVETNHRVTLCDESNHHVYHSDCLKIHDRGETSDCPECAREESENRNAPPCAACGELVRGASWTVNDCIHGLHPRCFKMWSDGRLEGCIACGQMRPICPVCERPSAECDGHVLARCKKCRVRVFEELIDKHDCKLSDDKPCFRCGRSLSTHKEPCAKFLAPLMRWNHSRPGHFFYVCPLCPEAVPDLADHVEASHSAIRHSKCGFTIAKHAASTHRSACGSTKICPAEGCSATVTATDHKLALSDPSILYRGHGCRGLYACPFECGTFFYLPDDMSDHVEACVISLAPRGTATKRRRAAFERSQEIVLICAEESRASE